MVYAFAIILSGLAGTYVLEQIRPRKQLPEKEGWLVRALSFNLLQLVIVMLGYYTWERQIVLYTEQNSLFKLSSYNWSPFYGGLLAYFINTWLFYWWHRARHEIQLMWDSCHQLHHSAERIELITSFYKHPCEIIVNSIIITILIFQILGLTFEDNAWFTIFSAFSEFFYHINIETPHWIGWIIQRPESHRVHHMRDRLYCSNYSDLPLWDILGGTFDNPIEDVCETGFSNNKELRLKDILLMRNVLKKKKTWKLKQKIIPTFLLVIGCLSTLGVVFNVPQLKSFGLMTVSSPLPFVFSAYNGVETFASTYHIDAELKNGTRFELEINPTTYDKLQGAYTRRNVYGAIFTHGPFFNSSQLIEMRDSILTNSMCVVSGRHSGFLFKEFGYEGQLKNANITIRSKTNGFVNKVWELSVKCPG